VLDDVTRILVDNYQMTTLAAIKHRSDIIESVVDDDEIEWTEDPFESKAQPSDGGSTLVDLIQIEGPPSGLCAKNIQTSSLQPSGGTS